MVYVFDFAGEFVCSGSIKQLSEQLKIHSDTIKTAIRRKSLVQRKYYFQENYEFVKPKKKIAVNPLDKRKVYTRKTEEERFAKKKKYTENDKDAIINKLISDEIMANKYNTTVAAIQVLRSKLLSKR